MNANIYNRSFCHTFSLPSGKWNARIRFRAYKGTKKCAGLQVYDVTESSMLYSVLYDDDIIIEIGHESIIGLCCEIARAKLEEAIKKRNFFTIYRGPCIGKRELSPDVNKTRSSNADKKVSDKQDSCSYRSPNSALGSVTRATEMINKNVSKNALGKMSLTSRVSDGASKTNVTNCTHDMLKNAALHEEATLNNKQISNNLPMMKKNTNDSGNSTARLNVQSNEIKEKIGDKKENREELSLIENEGRNGNCDSKNCLQKPLSKEVPLSLAQPDFKNSISKYQLIVLENLEFYYVESNKTCSSSSRIPNKQLNIRCRSCGLSSTSLSVLSDIGRAIMDLGNFHYPQCKKLPEKLRQTMIMLRTRPQKAFLSQYVQFLTNKFSIVDDGTMLFFSPTKFNVHKISTSEHLPPKFLKGIDCLRTYEGKTAVLTGLRNKCIEPVPKKISTFIDLTDDNKEDCDIVVNPVQVNVPKLSSETHVELIRQTKKTQLKKQKFKEEKKIDQSASEHMIPNSNHVKARKLNTNKKLLIIANTGNDTFDSNLALHSCNSESHVTSTPKARSKPKETKLNCDQTKEVENKISTLNDSKSNSDVAVNNFSENSKKQTEKADKFNQTAKNHLPILSAKPILSAQKEKPIHTIKIKSPSDKHKESKIPEPENLDTSKKEISYDCNQHLKVQIEKMNSSTQISNAELTKNINEKVSSLEMICQDKKPIGVEKTIMSASNVAVLDATNRFIDNNRQTKQIHEQNHRAPLCNNLGVIKKPNLIPGIKEQETVNNRSSTANATSPTISYKNVKQTENTIPVHNLMTLNSRQLTHRNKHFNLLKEKMSKRRFTNMKDDADADSKDNYDPFEEIKDDSLVVNIDRGLVTDFIFLIVAQLQPYFHEDKKNSMKKAIGARCRHCASGKQAFHFLPSKQRHLKSIIQNTLPTHVLKCESIPSKMKKKLVQLKDQQLQEYTKIPASSVNSFYDKVWEKLQAIQHNYTNKVVCDDEHLIYKDRLIDFGANIPHSRKGLDSQGHTDLYRKICHSDIPLIDKKTPSFHDDQYLAQMSKNQEVIVDQTNYQRKFSISESIDNYIQHNAGNVISQVEYAGNNQNLETFSRGIKNETKKVNDDVKMKMKANISGEKKMRTRSQRKNAVKKKKIHVSKKNKA